MRIREGREKRGKRREEKGTETRVVETLTT